MFQPLKKAWHVLVFDEIIEQEAERIKNIADIIDNHKDMNIKSSDLK